MSAIMGERRDPFASLDLLASEAASAADPPSLLAGLGPDPDRAAPSFERNALSGAWPARDAHRLLGLEVAAGAEGNPLIAAARPLLAAAVALRDGELPAPPEATALRQALIDAIARFEPLARAGGAGAEETAAARYVLCTFVDECVAGTPWGQASEWPSRSLLVHFHHETAGGERVFILLDRLAREVDQHRRLLELMALVLALGLRGRYQLLDGGTWQLRHLRQRLQALLRQDSPAGVQDLSLQWQGSPAVPVRLSDGVPLWVVGALLAVLMTALFLGLRLSLGRTSAPAFDALAMVGLGGHPPRLALERTMTPSASPRLVPAFAADIAANVLQVMDLADRSVIRIAGDGLFETGSAVVSAADEPLLLRIAKVLNERPGSVLITGHTDAQPISNARFPSNWALSQARAEVVKAALASVMAADRLHSEGRAGMEPLASDDSAEGRARNRRVEITWFPSPDALRHLNESIHDDHP
ncbi:type VI secretion system protein TssL, long form [Roseateles amylovorans]|uniref:Type VI secretion system protein TssL, long form n=1 Tax=Roseateles amylovorans TaxID=2978473 RepID=A0ABY6B4Q7_9BURK|nr:type VI secretion system protein TssL, long form [Roseateles amylovorans]UXH78528.1 type VI secretion system protein TssL, long form [Roseateles amylovorans]